MPRNYASEETLLAALKREGLESVGSLAIEKDGERFKPVFITTDPALIKRLDSEGFEHRAPEPPAGLNLDPIEPDDGPSDDTSGETEAAGTPAPEPDELDDATTEHLISWLGGRDPKDLPRLANPHLSDLFFNYDTDNGDSADPAAVKARAEQFASSILGAFGVAVDPDELVTDFYARL